MRIHWTNLSDRIGVAYGYSTHQKRLFEALVRQGVKISEDASVAVHLTTADTFKPVKGKFNILYCLAPETRVLTTDLKWEPIKNIQIGDELIGFDETLGRHNSYRRSRVIGTSKLFGKAYRIQTTKGSVTASGNHMWVATNHPNSKVGQKRESRNKNCRRWVRTDELRPGMIIVQGHSPWKHEKTYDSGWLAGFLDGEGHVSNSGNGNCVGFAQKPGETLDLACKILSENGFTFHKNRNRHSGTWGVQIHGGLRALGIFRPQRLLKRAHLLWEGKRTWSRYDTEKAEVISIEQVGEQELIGTMTETGTLIAEGFLSHNTMYECTTLPPGWPERVDQADLVVVPCRQNQELFKQYTKKPVEICLEGVDIDKYVYKERTFPTENKPFIFLWLGATNPRKGTEHVGGAWGLWNAKHPELRDKTMLVMKTTQEMNRKSTVELEIKDSYGEMIDKGIKKVLEMPAERIMNVAGNAIVDTRRLPVVLEGEPNPKRPDSLVEIYHWAHAFLLPSRGEGFGLTLAEAASTGLPCIYTPWGGPRDFMTSEWGYPVKWKFAPVRTVAWDKKKGETYISHQTYAASADIKHIVRRMEQVYFGYEAALKRGKKAAAHIRKYFTWDISARRMIEIIEKYTDERLEENAA